MFHSKRFLSFVSLSVLLFVEITPAFAAAPRATTPPRSQREDAACVMQRSLYTARKPILVVRMRLKNVGGTVWKNGTHALAYSWDDVSSDSATHVSLRRRVVRPRQSVVITLRVTLPEQAGDHQFKAQMVNGSGEAFGQACSETFHVSSPDSAASSSSGYASSPEAVPSRRSSTASTSPVLSSSPSQSSSVPAVSSSSSSEASSSSSSSSSEASSSSSAESQSLSPQDASSDGGSSRVRDLEPRRPPSIVVYRRMFYNNSAWDAHEGFPEGDPAANAFDENAIPPDKAPLLPGGTATFANYTSFAKGINGLIIDIRGMRGVPAAGDFTFKTGNSNDPSSWIAASAPASMTVREGMGKGGSDRITLIWNDGDVRNTWLQVTMLATENTRLAADDVFYVGNAVGEAGNAATDVMVNATDEILVRNNPLAPAPIDDRYDYDRNALVDEADEILARNNRTGPFNSLRLITVPSGGA